MPRSLSLLPLLERVGPYLAPDGVVLGENTQIASSGNSHEFCVQRLKRRDDVYYPLKLASTFKLTTTSNDRRGEGYTTMTMETESRR